MTPDTLDALGESYFEQIQAMHEKALEWRKANPTREVLIQFNFPPKTFLACPISSAIEHNFVSANEAGLELIKSLAPWDCRREPTVMMVKVAVEHENKQNNQTERQIK